MTDHRRALTGRMRRLGGVVAGSDTWSVVTALATAGWRPTAAVAAAVLAGAALPIVLILSTGRLVAEVLGEGSGGEADPLPWLVVVVVVFAGQLVLGAISSLGLARVGRRIDFVRTQQMMRSLLAPAEIAHLEDASVRDDLARAQGVGVGATPGTAVAALATIATRRIQGLGALVVLATVDARLALVVGAVQLAFIRFWQRAFARLTTWATERTPELRRGDWFRDSAMGQGAAKEIRLFGLGDWFAERFHAHWLAGMTPVWQGWRSQRMNVGLAIALPSLATAAAVIHVGRGALEGLVTIAALVVATQSAVSAGNLASANEASRLISAAGAAARAGSSVASVGARAAGAEGTQPVADADGHTIEFIDVGFRYPGRDRWVLRHLDLVVPAGSSLGVVGVNGAGKTTIVRLLAGLVEPDEGRVEIDGTPLERLDPRSWRRQLAVVFQDFARYQLPVRDNVGFGRIEGARNEEALRRAAASAGVASVIEALPSGWETPLSRQMEGGVELSGGEWQRIALARALFAVQSGASVLVLDEPVASLDVRAEAEIYDRFLELTSGITAIVISHRFSTVRRADRIAVIEDGRVTEAGSHLELMDVRGRYFELFSLQAARFGAVS